MFQLDDNFLEELGLGALPEEQKKPFLEYVYNQLERRVGLELSQGMTDEQLDEFAKIADRVPGAVDEFLAKHDPEYATKPMFKDMMQVTGSSADDPRLKNEYAASRWLEINRPDYRDVVKLVMEKLKQEIIANRDVILGNAPAPVADTPAA